MELCSVQYEVSSVHKPQPQAEFPFQKAPATATLQRPKCIKLIITQQVVGWLT